MRPNVGSSIDANVGATSQTDDTRSKYDDMPPLIRRRNLSIHEKEENKRAPKQIKRNSMYDQSGTTVGDTQGDIGPQEYCLIVETEGLTLLNEGKVSREEKDDFSFMQRII